MNGRKYINAIRAYCDYIERHLENVAASWKLLQVRCKDMHFIYDDYVFHSINEEVRHHDLSKFSPEEFIQYQRRFFPADGEEPGTIGDAWEHHKKNNPHHWENWTADDFYNPYEPEVHCVHMVVDWMAMGLEFGDTAEEFYERKKERIILPEWAVTFIGKIFERLREPTSTTQNPDTEKAR